MIPFLDKDKVVFILKKQLYDDIVDRLHYFYSVLILIVFSFAVSGKQYLGSPMQCWVPQDFSVSWLRYAETYCFIQGTYYLPFESRLDSFGQSNLKVGYYQWVPICLFFQAILFSVPNMLWKWLCGLSGINVKSILTMAIESVGFDPAKRATNVKTLSRTISTSLKIESDIAKRSGTRSYICACLGLDRCRSSSSYLCWLYLLVKLLNLINVVGQFFLIDAFLGANNTFWGGRVLSDIMHGRQWTESGHFPRVTMCNFTVRNFNDLKNPDGTRGNKYLIQCVLMINLWNEKIYLLLWCWMMFVALMTVWNLIGWIYVCCRSTSMKRFIKKYLRVGLPNGFDADHKDKFRHFVFDGLRSDGVLLLRFISGHAGDLLTTDLIVTLFQDYVKKAKQKRQRDYDLSMTSVTVHNENQNESGFSERHVERGVLRSRVPMMA